MEEGATILKKITPNGKMVVYLRCRDYASIEEPIDGGITVSAEYLQHRKVFGQLIAHFQYGREKDEVMGLKFSKDFVLASKQIYPPVDDEELTDTQIAIKKKICSESNNQLYPFKFYFPNAAPKTVTLFSKRDSDPEKACGIHYFVNIFVGCSENDIKHKRNSVKVNIRRIQYAPVVGVETAPQTLVKKSFVACHGNVELEATLDKLIFETNEKIPVNISIQNNSNKTVKKIRLTLFQKVSIQMLQYGEYKRVIDRMVTSKKCAINPGASFQTIMLVVAKLSRKRMEDGVALDGYYRFEESDLASSTFLHSYPVKDVFGIIVNYILCVKLYVGSLNTAIIANLPVVIMPTRPNKETPIQI